MKRWKLTMLCLLAIVLSALSACSSQPITTADRATESEIIEMQALVQNMGLDSPSLEYCSATVFTNAEHTGDLNGDRRLSIADIVLLNAYTKGKMELSDSAMQASDCTGNGVINGSDVIYLQGLVLGHTLRISKEGVLPTCTEDGLSEEISCSGCQKILAVQSTMEATGHIFVEDKCHCGAAATQVCITYVDNGDGTTTARFSIEGNVNMAMIELQLSFVLENTSYSDYEVLVRDGLAEANYDDGIFYFSYMSVNDVTEDTDLFEVTFANASDNIGITVAVVDSCISDGTFEKITPVSVIGTTYKTYDR